MSTGERRKVHCVFKTDAEIQNVFLTCVCRAALLQIGTRELECSFRRCERLLMKSVTFYIPEFPASLTNLQRFV